MGESERDRLEREVGRFRFGQADMRLAAAAAEALQREQIDVDNCRALETATVVSYAAGWAPITSTGLEMG